MSKPFWKLLTKAERAHLRDSGVRNVQTFIAVRAKQAIMTADRRKHGLGPVCFECNRIAAKTGHK